MDTTNAAKLLSKPLTAAQLADQLGVSRPTAYSMIRALKAKKVGEVRQGAKGPKAATYQVKS